MEGPLPICRPEKAVQMPAEVDFAGEHVAQGGAAVGGQDGPGGIVAEEERVVGVQSLGGIYRYKEVNLSTC